MPSKVALFDNVTGETVQQFGVTAREAVAADPARYSITDDAAEVAARNGSGIREVSHTVLDSRSRRSG